TEERFVEALRLAQPAIAELITAQEALVRAVGKPKIEWTPEKVDPAKEARVAEFFKDRIRGKVRNPDTAQREVGLDELKREGIAALVSRGGSEGGVPPSDSIREAEVSLPFDAPLKKEVRRAILHEGLRPDGRGLKDIRPLSIEGGVLPRRHGPALFQRAQTQTLPGV